MREIMLRFTIPLLSLLALIAAFLLFPWRAGIIAASVLALGIGISIVSILRSQSWQYRAGQIERGALVRNCLVEITGMLLALALSILLGRLAMGYVIAQVSGMWGFILGMLAAVICGVAISLLVRSTWGRLVQKPGAQAELPPYGSS